MSGMFAKLQKPASSLLAGPRLLQRKCACGANEKCDECQASNFSVQRRASGAAAPMFAPPIVHEVLQSPGQPLDASTRAFMEPRFGHSFSDSSNQYSRTQANIAINSSNVNESQADEIADLVLHGPALLGRGHDFSSVRIYTNSKAAESARAVGALAYTVGSNIVFGAGQYSPDSSEGKHLLAHELTHVIQQSKRGPELQRQMDPLSDSYSMDDDLYYFLFEHKEGAPNARFCESPVAECKKPFCEPYSSETLAQHMQQKQAPMLLGALSALNPSTADIWADYYWGGDPSQRNLSARFARDFTASKSVANVTRFLYEPIISYAKTIRLPFGRHVLADSILQGGGDFVTPLGPFLAAINQDKNPNSMDFAADPYNSVPGLLAGGIGKQDCAAGKNPSLIDDARLARIEVDVQSEGVPGVCGSSFVIKPIITYRVVDTVDFCPGNCGSEAARVLTIQLSQFEATGIAGDIPYLVEFPAPSDLLAPLRIPQPCSSTGQDDKK